MYLLIDTISEPSCIILFDESREIISETEWAAKMHEFDTLIETIDAAMKKNSLKYSDLQGIIVTVGPGGFTGTRITTLVANTLAFDFQIPLIPLEVSDILNYLGVPKPWIMPVTRREVMIWKEGNNAFDICLRDELPTGNYSSLVPFDLVPADSTIETVRDHESLVKNLSLTNEVKRVHPHYAKAPNITQKP